MSDGRLKQIWAGFERTTTRQLTNRAVDHIVTPDRAGWKAEDAALLPRGYEGPSATAFQALRARIVDKARNADRKDGRLAKGERDTALPEIAYAAPESDAARDLIRALKSTEYRTRRTQFDYADALERPAKKSLFGGSQKAAPVRVKKSADASHGDRPKKRFWLF